MIDERVAESVPFLRHLSAARRKRLLAASTIERYRRGTALFHQGARAECVWIILEGWVHLVRHPDNADRSRAVVLFTITPDEVLCGISAIASGTYNLSAIAGTECQVVRIPGTLFKDALLHEPGFAFHALRLCARRLQHIAEQYGAMAEPVPSRIIRAILRLQQQFGRTLPVTHRELAQMSWTTTESAIRTVRQMKRRGYVTGTRGRLTVTKPDELATILLRRDGEVNV